MYKDLWSRMDEVGMREPSLGPTLSPPELVGEYPTVFDRGSHRTTKEINVQDQNVISEKTSPALNCPPAPIGLLRRVDGISRKHPRSTEKQRTNSRSALFVCRCRSRNCVR